MSFKIANYDINKTILVVSSPRGGSTWLAELVGTLPGYPILWEPLQISSNKRAKKVGFTWNNYLGKHEDQTRKREYVRKVLSGQELVAGIVPWKYPQFGKYASFRGFLVKFTNANMLLPWLCREFPLRTVFLVRHPCAVIASQLSHGGWENTTKETVTFPENVQKAFPKYVEVYNTLETKEEVMAFEWGLQSLVPLAAPKPHAWCFTTYEDLVLNGEAELKRIFDYLGEEVPEEAIVGLKKASKSTQSGSNVSEKKSPLSGWQDKLSDQQIKSILRVTRDMGCTFYSEELEPNF